MQPIRANANIATLEWTSDQHLKRRVRGVRGCSVSIIALITSRFATGMPATLTASASPRKRTSSKRYDTRRFHRSRCGFQPLITVWFLVRAQAGPPMFSGIFNAAALFGFSLDKRQPTLPFRHRTGVFRLSKTGVHVSEFPWSLKKTRPKEYRNRPQGRYRGLPLCDRFTTVGG